MSERSFTEAEVDGLLDRYYDWVASEQPPKLVEFVTAILDEAPNRRDLVDRFLDRLEVIVLGNIEDKLSESPGAQALAEAAADATRAEVARARETLAQHPG